jgi:hypothetical protein
MAVSRRRTGEANFRARTQVPSSRRTSKSTSSASPQDGGEPGAEAALLARLLAKGPGGIGDPGSLVDADDLDRLRATAPDDVHGELPVPGVHELIAHELAGNQGERFD